MVLPCNQAEYQRLSQKKLRGKMQKLIKNLNYIWNKFKKSNTQFFSELEEQLILSDVSAITADKIVTDIKDKTFGENITDLDKIIELLKNELIGILNNRETENTQADACQAENKKPQVWMVVGINGVGKTSTIAKLANYFKKMDKSVLLTSADTYRAAAYEQLNHFAQALNIPIVHHQRFSDPGAVVYDSVEKAFARNIDIILIDTAGRMHTQFNLMEELKKVKRVITKKINRDPDEIIMVIDSTTGQN
ncbi:MAG: signal recognition particle-docking protein FtsY, partial [Actinobacteria bacterium]|nr:signal recognition particle-docking protein FtsY [Actinomycetota bacterium]